MERYILLTEKKAGVAILISGRVDIRTRKTSSNTEEYYILLNELIQLEEKNK